MMDDSLDLSLKIKERCNMILELEAKFQPLLNAQNLTEVAFNSAMAVAVLKLKSDGVQMAIIDKVAKDQTKAAYLDFLTAEANVEANKSFKRSLGVTISALQTIFPKHSHL